MLFFFASTLADLQTKQLWETADSKNIIEKKPTMTDIVDLI
jgi:hypothetical protein